MKALVVYETMFGNTQLIAEAIAAGLGEYPGVEMREVGDATAEDVRGADLLVAGGPVHAFSMSRESTRRDAVLKSSKTVVSNGQGIREWLESLPAGDGKAAAAFDTRLSLGIVPVGSVAKPVSDRLTARGYRLVAKPEGFIVKGREGPLKDGEEARAREWGRKLAQAVAEPAAR